MATIAYRDPCVVVYDDFLDEGSQELILEYFDAARFERILPRAWGSAFRLSDGDPLVGIEVLSETDGNGSKCHTYPTRTALDILIEKLLGLREEISETVGVYGTAWARFSVCPYVYPTGSALGWHADGHAVGAYVYYAHRTWRMQWGGELLVGVSGTGGAYHSTSSRGIIERRETNLPLDKGMGYYFSATPNRLILMRGGVPHMVKRVEAAAGDNLRLSISGFFLADSKDRGNVEVCDEQPTRGPSEQSSGARSEQGAR